jgi:hypothetical protein
MVEMKTYRLYRDSGHGWLAVSHKEIIRYNLEDKISGYSRMDSEKVYLEEDRDKHIFLDALKKMELEFIITKHYKDGFSAIRNKPSYSKKFVRDIPENGTGKQTGK